MRTVFADAFYWIATSDRQDSSHAVAVEFARRLRAATIVTTHEVLVEFLTFHSKSGPGRRRAAVQALDTILGAPNVRVETQSEATFHSGLGPYRSRPDKGYSMTDCISMETMRRMEIQEVLTHDQHFTQEGFVTLL